MRASSALRLALAASLTTALAAACSSGNGATSAVCGGSGGCPSDAGSPDAPAAVGLRIDPVTSHAVVTIGTPPSPVSFRAYAKVGSAPEQDVSAMADWSVGPAIGSIAGGVVTLTGAAGQAVVSATYMGQTATSSLAVMLTGDVFGPGTDMTTKMGFDGATPDLTPMTAPVLEYPEDGVVLPANLPPIEAQWTQGAAGNTAYRVHVVNQNVDVHFYTTARELLFPADAWKAIAAASADIPTTLTVDALAATKLHAGAPRTFTISGDTIDNSAIYVWQSSTGSFRVIDVIAGTEIPLPNDSPALAAGQPCSGCHRISRDGKRFAYTYMGPGANFQFGTMAFDAAKATYTTKVTPSPAFSATYATFNPSEATQVPAMLVTVPDQVTPNTAGTVRLEVLDPDTRMAVPSNIAQALAMIDPAVGHGTSMPDWSPDGSFVVFAAYDTTKNFVRLLGDDIVAASIVEVPVSYGKTTGFVFGTPKTLVQAATGAATTPDTGQNNLLPTISPDGSAVAFTRAAGWWSIKTQQSLLNLSGQIALVRRKDGQVLELVKGSNGPGTTQSSTWPQWAPSLGNRYAWLAYAAERPYGHRMSATNPVNCGSLVQGQKLCKHLWVTAIDLTKMGAGTADPSSAPFWIPAQTLGAQYVSPQWTKAVIKPAQ